MLQAAMAAEDAGDESQKEELTNEVDAAITELKVNLEGTGGASKESVMPNESSESISHLKEQLQASQATIETLNHELNELRTQVSEPDKSADQSANAVQPAEIEELKEKHQLEVSSLHKKIQDLVLSEQETAERSVKELENAKVLAMEANDTKTTQLLEDQRLLHVKAVEALNNDLAIERKTRGESAENVTMLEKQIEEHMASIATAAAKAEEYEKTVEDCRDQIGKRDRELQGQTSVIKSLEDELRALQQTHNAEVEALEKSSTDRVAELRAQISALKSAADQSSEKSAASDARTHEEMARKEKEITNLGQVIERLQDEVQQVHESKSNELDDKILQMRQEHEQITVALKAEHKAAMDGLAESHDSMIDKLGLEARNSRTAHERQIQRLNDEKSEMQATVEKSLNSLITSQEEAEKRSEELELKHNEQLRAANESLQSAETALADSKLLVQQTREEAEQTTATAIKTLEEKVAVLNEQCVQDATALRSARAELEAAQHQVESLKQILETIEKDTESKEQLQTETLGKAIAETEAAERALAEKVTSFEEAERKHAEVIEDLRSGHGVDLERVRHDLTQQHDIAFRELQAKHDELKSAHSKLEAGQQDETRQLQSEHQQALAASSKMMSDLRQEHASELEVVRDQMSTEHLQTLENVKKEFSSTAANAERTHSAALDDLKSTHENDLIKLRRDLEDSHLQSAATTKQSHDGAVKVLEEQLEKQKTELADARHEMQKPSESVTNPELENLKDDLQRSKKALTAAESETWRLAEEVQSLKLKHEEDQKIIQKYESASGRANEAQVNDNIREVQSLKEQLDGALQEAETQRANSDMAKKALQQSADRTNESKARIEELEAQLQRVNEKVDLEPKLGTPSNTRRRNRNKGAKNSPRTSQGKELREEGEGAVAASPTRRAEGETAGSSVHGTVGNSSCLLLKFRMDRKLTTRVFTDGQRAGADSAT